MADIKEQLVWEFADRLRNVIPFYGFSSSAIELIFIKYMSDYSDIDNPKDFKTIIDYKNMFINKKFDYRLTCDVFEIIERKFNIESNLFKIVLDDLEKIFDDKAEYVFDVLNYFELPKTNEDMISLIEIILSYSENKDVSRTESSTTNSSLIKLVNKILDVKENEIYMDSFSGFFKSSLTINAKHYIGYEINPNVAAISNMIMILTGKKSFKISNQDFYLSETNSIADKIFSDGPIVGMLSMDAYHLLGGESKRLEYYNIKKTVESLKQGGRGIVTCASGTLFRYDFRKLRELLTFRNLKAIIALPTLWRGLSVPTNLIILDNERQDNKICIIDASSNECIIRNDKRNVTLTDETIEKIIDSLNGKIIDGFSTLVTPEDILLANNDQSWVPASYIKKKLNINFRPSIEVEKDLELAYQELNKYLNK